MPRRPLLVLVGAAVAVSAVTSCGVPNADRDRAELLATTCLSTIARNGLPAPTPEQIDPERFAAERRRLLESGRRFNTVTPYRNVCDAIKKDLRASRTTTTDPAGDTGDDDEIDDGTPPVIAIVEDPAEVGS